MSATSAKSDQINIYGYTPTFPGALVFSIVFLLLSIVHLVLTFLSRRWVTILFFVFGISESDPSLPFTPFRSSSTLCAVITLEADNFYFHYLHSFLLFHTTLDYEQPNSLVG